MGGMSNVTLKNLVSSKKIFFFEKVVLKLFLILNVEFIILKWVKQNNGAPQLTKIAVRLRVTEILGTEKNEVEKVMLF